MTRRGVDSDLPMSGIGAIPPVFCLAMWRVPKARGGGARQISLSRRGLFKVYLCSRSQLISSTNGDLISGFKIAEYFDQVNPLMAVSSQACNSPGRRIWRLSSSDWTVVTLTVGVCDAGEEDVCA